MQGEGQSYFSFTSSHGTYDKLLVSLLYILLAHFRGQQARRGAPCSVSTLYRSDRYGSPVWMQGEGQSYFSFTSSHGTYDKLLVSLLYILLAHFRGQQARRGAPCSASTLYRSDRYGSPVRPVSPGRSDEKPTNVARARSRRGSARRVVLGSAGQLGRLQTSRR
jgi:hypothetical protein